MRVQERATKNYFSKDLAEKGFGAGSTKSFLNLPLPINKHHEWRKKFKCAYGVGGASVLRVSTPVTVAPSTVLTTLNVYHNDECGRCGPYVESNNSLNIRICRFYYIPDYRHL